MTSTAKVVLLQRNDPWCFATVMCKTRYKYLKFHFVKVLFTENMTFNLSRWTVSAILWNSIKKKKRKERWRTRHEILFCYRIQFRQQCLLHYQFTIYFSLFYTVFKGTFTVFFFFFYCISALKFSEIYRWLHLSIYELITW